jgi:hypothetical protein
MASSGTYRFVVGIPTNVGTSGSTPVVLATGVTGEFHFQGINRGTIEALISFDGEQTTPTYGFAIPPSSANAPPWVISLTNATILLSRGNASSDVTGFSLTGI